MADLKYENLDETIEVIGRMHVNGEVNIWFSNLNELRIFTANFFSELSKEPVERRYYHQIDDNNNNIYKLIRRI